MALELQLPSEFQVLVTEVLHTADASHIGRLTKAAVQAACVIHHDDLAAYDFWQDDIWDGGSGMGSCGAGLFITPFGVWAGGRAGGGPAGGSSAQT